MGVSGKVDSFGHFYTVYKNIDELKFKFNQQLDKLVVNGFIGLNSDQTRLRQQAVSLLKTSWQVGPSKPMVVILSSAIIIPQRSEIQMALPEISTEKDQNKNLVTRSQVDTGGGAFIVGDYNQITIANDPKHQYYLNNRRAMLQRVRNF